MSDLERKPQDNPEPAAGTAESTSASVVALCNDAFFASSTMSAERARKDEDFQRGAVGQFGNLLLEDAGKTLGKAGAAIAAAFKNVLDEPGRRQDGKVAGGRAPGPDEPGGVNGTKQMNDRAPQQNGDKPANNQPDERKNKDGQLNGGANKHLVKRQALQDLEQAGLNAGKDAWQGKAFQDLEQAGLKAGKDARQGIKAAERERDDEAAMRLYNFTNASRPEEAQKALIEIAKHADPGSPDLQNLKEMGYDVKGRTKNDVVADLSAPLTDQREKELRHSQKDMRQKAELDLQRQANRAVRDFLGSEGQRPKAANLGDEFDHLSKVCKDNPYAKEYAKALKERKQTFEKQSGFPNGRVDWKEIEKAEQKFANTLRNKLHDAENKEASEVNDKWHNAQPGSNESRRLSEHMLNLAGDGSKPAWNVVRDRIMQPFDRPLPIDQ
jgi:hypothetical protein